MLSAILQSGFYSLILVVKRAKINYYLRSLKKNISIENQIIYDTWVIFCYNNLVFLIENKGNLSKFFFKSLDIVYRK